VKKACVFILKDDEIDSNVPNPLNLEPVQGHTFLRPRAVRGLKFY